MTTGDRSNPNILADEASTAVYEGAAHAEDTALARSIGSTLANIIGLELERFVPVPSRSAPSSIRNASGILKILLLEETTIPVGDIQGFLGISGSPASLINNAGVFKDRLFLGISPHHVISPETSRLQMDTVEKMLGLVQRRRLVPKPYTGRQRSVVGLGPHPSYELVET